MWSIDDYVSDSRIDSEQIAAVRMDVEGYELEVLRGMKHTLEQAEDLLLFIEVHPDQLGQEDLRDLLSILEKKVLKLYL